MKSNEKLIYEIKKLIMIRYPMFGAEIAKAKIELKNDLPYHTAATDGKNIYFDPDYLATLSDNDKLFLVAHELMHIKFEHMYRLINKDGKKRNLEIWNEATDAIINANLERDGFTIKKGYVNRPEALKYTAEEFYQILLNENQKKKNQSDKNQNNEQQNQNDNNINQDNNSDETENKMTDDHSLWEDAFEYQNDSKNETGKDLDSNSKDDENDEDDIKNEYNHSEKFNERVSFENNRIIRKKLAKERFEKMTDQGLNQTGRNIDLGNIETSKSIIDWKLLLRREVERTETVWSQRRSILENNYAYRLEENDIEDQAVTEVMIDVSGSVSLEMIRDFLRQLKPLLKESKLKVGCFNEKFWGMIEIKSDRDINKFGIPQEARGESSWTENWDLAVRSFSKEREINKIVFTDGIPCPGIMPKDDLKGTNVIWLVYSNKEFNPCCGKVIMLDKNKLIALNSVNKNEPELAM